MGWLKELRRKRRERIEAMKSKRRDSNRKVKRKRKPDPIPTLPPTSEVPPTRTAPPVVIPPPSTVPPPSKKPYPAGWPNAWLPKESNLTMLAIDCVEDINSAQWFKDAYALGVDMYIPHATTWEGEKTGGGFNEVNGPWQFDQLKCNIDTNVEKYLGYALAAGMKIAVYTRNPRCWQNGILAAGKYVNQLQFFAVDIEYDPPFQVTRAMIDGIKAMGVKPIIYSQLDMWKKVMGSSTAFSDVQLWDTQEPTFRPFGGWTSRVGSQGTWDFKLNGHLVDLNMFDPSIINK